MLPTAIVVSLLKLVGTMANMGTGNTPISTPEVKHNMDRVPRETTGCLYSSKWNILRSMYVYSSIYVTVN
jgi:hypothetical protein